jgi:hypothetical protein
MIQQGYRRSTVVGKIGEEISKELMSQAIGHHYVAN